MKKFIWEGHYTGIDCSENKIGKYADLYLQRDSKSKLLTFARLSFFRKMVGFKIKHYNPSIEFFTNDFHLGFNKRTSMTKTLNINYSGSGVDPFYRISFLLFDIFSIGFTCPKMVQRIQGTGSFWILGKLWRLLWISWFWLELGRWWYWTELLIYIPKIKIGELKWKRISEW